MSPAPVPRPLHSIGDVLRALEDIIDWARATASPLGYFAVIYYHVTMQMMVHIRTPGYFDDPALMQQFDVTFAARYLEAVWAWGSGRPCSQSWRVSFDAASVRRVTILQHLFLGVNAHMRLDLPVAAATVAPHPAINGLRGDFFRVNRVLEEMISMERIATARLSPRLALLMCFQSNQDRVLARLARQARAQAWTDAVSLAMLSAAARTTAVQARLDPYVARLANGVLNPHGSVDRISRWIWPSESQDVAANIGALL